MGVSASSGLGLSRDLSARSTSSPGDLAVRALGPVGLAIVVGGLLLLALGHDPVSFYVDIGKGAFQFTEWQDTVTRLASLTLVALAMIFPFRAAVWNLGVDGQFIVAAAVVSGAAPSLTHRLQLPLALLLLFLIAAAAGAAWALLPAVLRVRYQISEVVTSLMMTFLGIDVARVLIKGPFADPQETFQTRVIPLQHRLPTLLGTRIHIGILIAAALVLGSYYVLSQTPFGLRIDILGKNVRAARHAGLRVARLTITVFLISGALAGVAAAFEVVGVLGYARSDWNPAFAFQVLPFVFLARLSPLAIVPYLFLLSLLQIGGDFATQSAGVSSDFLLVLMATTLLCMATIEYARGRAPSNRQHSAFWRFLNDLRLPHARRILWPAVRSVTGSARSRDPDARARDRRRHRLRSRQ